MSSRSGIFGALSAAVVTAALLLAVTAPTAAAAFGVAKWEAGTCTVSACNYASPNLFFTQAAGHPPAGFTDFTFNTSGGQPEGAVKDVRVDLPEGLNVNPQATAQCPKTTFESNEAACATMGSQVGSSEVTSEIAGLPVGPLSFPVYNLDPPAGHPALFGFTVGLPLIPIAKVYLVADVNWAGDYHEGFSINEIPNTLPLVRNRLVFEGTKGEGTPGGAFLTLGSQCNGPSTTILGADSYEGASAGPYSTTPPASIDECKSVPFNPGVSASVTGTATDSPGPVSVTATVPQGTQPQNDSTLKTANVSLPVGLGLNPAAAPSLKMCADNQFSKGTEKAITCPKESEIGTVSIQTPVLPPNSLTGPVYLAEQKSREPESGEEYRVFVNARSSRYGVDVRLVGNVKANARTGQLTAVFANAPQVAFSSVTLQFKGGDTAPLTSPPICTTTTAAVMVPWSGNADATPSSPFKLTNAPGGGPCALTMASRPFAPGFTARPGTTAALAYTPFMVHLTGPQGQQELKGVDITLPPGATAKLAGVPYCPPSAIAASATKSGAEEKKNATCPGDSLVGVALIQAGTGSTPLQIDGKAYLAGPYRSAPLSLVVVTPALAGPFDLGTVVVRVALNLDPETAQINPVAEIPDVFGGAKLDIRSILVNVNRKEFTLNGTNCNKNATAGVLNGGGADPTNPAAFSSFAVSDATQGTGCNRLKFKPKLKLRLFGATKRNKNPRLRAALVTRPGDANVARASVALPHAIFLDQASLAKVCTRVQFAAGECPKKSIYGHARAFSPLLGKPLEGPVYLRSSNNLLPDLVAHLQGQVDIDLVGRIDSFKGGIRTTFDRVPDVPVTKFVLTLPGGKHGLLVASTNLCRKPVRAIVQLKGQNGKKANRRTKVRTPCGKKEPKGHHKKGKG
jgi:hypothetical protein